MSEKSENVKAAEGPESPSVVGKATDTIARLKVKPKAAAPEKTPETTRETAPEKRPETPGKPDNALSIFGWDV